jgi:hypothetical protein
LGCSAIVDDTEKWSYIEFLWNLCICFVTLVWMVWFGNQCLCPVSKNSPDILWKDWGKPRNTSIRITGNLTRIQMWYPWNKRPGFYHSSNLTRRICNEF